MKTALPYLDAYLGFFSALWLLQPLARAYGRRTYRKAVADKVEREEEDRWFEALRESAPRSVPKKSRRRKPPTMESVTFGMIGNRPYTLHVLGMSR